MWHRIAQRLGCTVAEAQVRLDGRQFDEERAFALLEPWGFHVLEEWFATIAHLLSRGAIPRDKFLHKPFGVAAASTGSGQAAGGGRQTTEEMRSVQRSLRRPKITTPPALPVKSKPTPAIKRP